MTRIFSFGINCFGHSRWYCCTGVSYARKLLLAGDNVGNMTMMEKEGGKVCIQRIIFSLAAIGSMQYHPIILRACLSLVIISAKNLKRHVSFLKVLYAKTCAYKDICSLVLSPNTDRQVFLQLSTPHIPACAQF